MKKKILALLCLCALAFVACSNEKKQDTNKTAATNTQATAVAASNEKLVSDEDFSLRKGDLSDEADAVLPNANFTTLQPGESKLIDRAFENAPPLISHAIEDMLPIVKDNNMCLSCHDKAIAADVGATSMPVTHYFDFQANRATNDVVSNERFNCTQCHVPQSSAQPLVANNFRPEFKSEDSKKKSNLFDILNEGVQ